MYVTSAWTIFRGWKISARRSSRGSGTLTTPTWSSIPPKPPVWTLPRVSVLKTVVLPDPASPTIAICMASVSGRGVHPVVERLPGNVAPQVRGEELDAPVQDAAARPGRVRREDDIGQVVERRARWQRLVAEPSRPSSSARSSARSTTRRPRATLTSHAVRFISARARSSTRSSVSTVRGSARITKSEAASRSPNASGPRSSTLGGSGDSPGRGPGSRR